MKIIAISDTHIRSGSIYDHLPGELIELLRNADLIIHAGDFVTRRAYDEFSSIGRLGAVSGNMDEPGLKNLLPEKKILEIEGLRIGLIHQAALSFQDTTGARYMAKEMGVDVLIFGHIHRPLIDKSDVLLVCPGSPTAPRMSEPCALELTADQGKISGKVLVFEGTRCGTLESAMFFRDHT